MKLSQILAVFRKDLKDVLRDRKTLIFMLLLPTALIPLLMMGVSRFIVRTQIKRELQKVTIAIPPGDEETLRRLIRQGIMAYDPKEVKDLIDAIQPGLMDRYLEALGKVLADDPGAAQKLLMGELPDSPELEAIQGELGELVQRPPEKKIELSPGQRKLASEILPLSKLSLSSKFVDLEEVEDLVGPGKATPPESYPDWVRGDDQVRSLADGITSKKIQAALLLPAHLERILREGEEGAEVTIYYDSTIPASQEAQRRIQGALDVLAKGLLKKRLAGKGLSEGFVTPFDVDSSNIAPKKKVVRAALGGLLPYIIILFSFLGAFYPALDLGAGEKERFTLETLLLSPASRFEIATGKFLVICASSMTAALLGIVSMGWTLSAGLIPGDILDLSFDPVALGACAILAIPVASIFASILLSVSIYARSFKEGQSYAAPLQFLIIIPALASLLPDIEISWRLALVPLVNISLVMKEFMKGDYRWDFFVVTLVSTALLAALAITFAAGMFNREQVIFRH